MKSSRLCALVAALTVTSGVVASQAFGAPTTTPTSTQLPSGTFLGTCGKDATGAKPCQVSFMLTDRGQRVANLQFEPPSCLVNNKTSSTVPVLPGRRFKLSITLGSDSPRFMIVGRIVSGTKAIATLTATCHGKTTTRTATLTKHGS